MTDYFKETIAPEGFAIAKWQSIVDQEQGYVRVRFSITTALEVVVTETSLADSSGVLEEIIVKDGVKQLAVTVEKQMREALK